MGGQSNMGGAASAQVEPMNMGMPSNLAGGMQSNMGGGNFDLSKLFMGNMPGGGMPSGGAAPLPQIQAPVRPPMPTMPQRTPMPMPQAPQQPNPMDPLAAFRKYAQEVQSMSGHERHLNRRNQGGGR